MLRENEDPERDRINTGGDILGRRGDGPAVKSSGICGACEQAGNVVKDVLLELLKADCSVMPNLVSFTRDFARGGFMENAELLRQTWVKPKLLK